MLRYLHSLIINGNETEKQVQVARAKHQGVQELCLERQTCVQMVALGSQHHVECAQEEDSHTVAILRCIHFEHQDKDAEQMQQITYETKQVHVG